MNNQKQPDESIINNIADYLWEREGVGHYISGLISGAVFFWVLSITLWALVPIIFLICFYIHHVCQINGCP
jgi:tetrahydromethanopterin S-methyltransferase subunit B